VGLVAVDKVVADAAEPLITMMLGSSAETSSIT
jgi:hypothetical protein